MEKAHSDKGCCHDENKLLKIQDDQKANYVSLDILKLSVSAAVSVDQSVACLLLQKKQLPSKSNAPPLIGDLDLCIRNCVFRI